VFVGSEELKEIMEKVDRLNAEDKAKLIKHLLGDLSPNVTIGSSADTVYQINLASSEQMSAILNVIADKISSNKNS
jgi:hypothetical protein